MATLDQYIEARKIAPNLFEVADDKKRVGIFNSKTKEIIVPVEFDGVKPYNKENKYWRVVTKDGVGIYNSDKKVFLIQPIGWGVILVSPDMVLVIHKAYGVGGRADDGKIGVYLPTKGKLYTTTEDDRFKLLPQETCIVQLDIDMEFGIYGDEIRELKEHFFYYNNLLVINTKNGLTIIDTETDKIVKSF